MTANPTHANPTHANPPSAPEALPTLNPDLLASLQTLTALQNQQLATLQTLTESLQTLLDRTPDPTADLTAAPELAEDMEAFAAPPPPLYRAPLGWLFHGLADQTERLERTYWEQALDRLAAVVDNLGLIRILGSIGNLALLLALLSWITGGNDRRQAQDYQAWGVISAAASIEPEYQEITAADGTTTQQMIIGSTGEGGRTAAIQALYANGVDLSGLEASGALLLGLDLGKRGSLGQPDRPCWRWLPWGCTAMARLYASDFEGADLYKANFQGANLKNANFQNALLSFSNLQDTDLARAMLTQADLTGANLRHANLQTVDFQETLLIGTRLADTRNLTDAQLAKAYLCGTPLPEGLETKGDRDCDAVVPVLVDRYSWFSTPEAAQAYIDSVLNPTEPAD